MNNLFGIFFVVSAVCLVLWIMRPRGASNQALYDEGYNYATGQIADSTPDVVSSTIARLEANVQEATDFGDNTEFDRGILVAIHDILKTKGEI